MAAAVDKLSNLLLKTLHLEKTSVRDAEDFSDKIVNSCLAEFKVAGKVLPALMDLVSCCCNGCFGECSRCFLLSGCTDQFDPHLLYIR
jgi:hypothetical protein